MSAAGQRASTNVRQVLDLVRITPTTGPSLERSVSALVGTVQAQFQGIDNDIALIYNAFRNAAYFMALQEQRIANLEQLLQVRGEGVAQQRQQALAIGMQAQESKAVALVADQQRRLDLAELDQQVKQNKELGDALTIVRARLAKVEASVTTALETAQVFAPRFEFVGSPDDLSGKVGQLTQVFRKRLDELTTEAALTETKLAEAEAQAGVYKSTIEDVKRERDTIVAEKAEKTTRIGELEIALAKAQSDATEAANSVDRLKNELKASQDETKVERDKFQQLLDENAKRASSGDKSADDALARMQTKLAEAEQRATDAENKRLEADAKHDEQVKALKASLAEAKTEVNTANKANQDKLDRLTKAEQKTREDASEIDKLKVDKLRLEEELKRKSAALQPGQVVILPHEAQGLLEAPGARWLSVWDQDFAAAQIAKQKNDAALAALRQKAGVDVKVSASKEPDAKAAAVGPDAAVNFVLVPDAADAAELPAVRKAALIADVKKDVAAVNNMDIDWQPDPTQRQLVISPAQASQDSMRAIMVAASGDWKLGEPAKAPQRFTYAEDILDIDAMCQDRAWALAIIELMGKGFYDPVVPLDKQLEYIYAKANDRSTELLFVLELLLVYNKMLDRTRVHPGIPDASRPIRIRHLESMIKHHVRDPLGQVGNVTHIVRIAKKVISKLDLIYYTAQHTQKRDALFWWTDSPLAQDTIQRIYQTDTNPRRKDLLAAHGYALRRMYASNPYTYHILAVSLTGVDQRYSYVFQQMCGVLWNASNFRANFNTIMDQPGGAFLMDLFMAAVNAPIYEKHFGLPRTAGFEARQAVYLDLYKNLGIEAQIGNAGMKQIVDATQRLRLDYNPPHGQRLLT